MTDDRTPNTDHPSPAPAPSAPAVDVRRVILITAVVVGGLAYFFWDNVRDVIQPPLIPPRETAIPYKVAAGAYLPVPPHATRDDKLVTVKSGQLDITFTRIGAAIIRLTWTDPRDGHAEPVISQDEVPNRAFLVELPGSENWPDHEFKLVDPAERSGATELVFERESMGGGLKLVKTFRIHADEPVIELKVEIKNLSPGDWVSTKGYTLKIANAVGEPSELDKDDCTITVRADRYTDHRPVRRVSGTEDWPTEVERKRAGHGPREVEPTLEWVALAGRYFGLLVRPEQPVFDARMKFTRTADAAVAVALELPPPKVPWVSDTFQIYAGPRDYDALAGLSDSAQPPAREQEWIDYWYFGRQTTLLLESIHRELIANYGVAIILVTIIFRLLMWPVTSYNLRSMVDIKVANARLAEIDAREPPRSQKEERAWWLKEARVWEDLQRKATIGVFLPMVILLPVLLILYYTLRLDYTFYRQPLALWITDISRRDPWFVLPLLMGLAMMGQLRTMSENPARERSWILMPAAFTVLFAFFSAGLVLFWLTDTLVGWLQLALIKRGKARHPARWTAVDRAEHKIAAIRAEREQRAAKPAPGSSNQ